MVSLSGIKVVARRGGVVSRYTVDKNKNLGVSLS